MYVNYIFFLIIILLIIFIIFRFILADYNNMKLTNPIIIPNTINISKMTPNVKIHRSQDQMGGLEYTYTFWLWIHGDRLKKDNKYNVFLKGNSHKDDNNDNTENIQSPGVWIEKSSNQAKMIIYTNLYIPDNCSDFNKIKECPKYCNWVNPECLSKNSVSNLAGVEVDNIPIDNWVHFTISVTNRIMDIYVNGELYNQMKFDALPRQNDNDITIGAYNNLNGKLSDLRYFNYTLTPYEIEKIVNREIPPLDTSSSLGRNGNNYLSKYYWVGNTYNDKIKK